RRIVAIGDLHGDIKSALRVLQMAGVANRKGKWIGGDNTILVQTGDLIDRGPDTNRMLELLPDLVKSANKVGGRVIQILGNHEVMNLAGNLRYVRESEKEFSSELDRAKAFDLLGRFGKRLSNLPVVYRVGDTVFAHGGITPEWAESNMYQTNQYAKTQLKKYVADKKQNQRVMAPAILGNEGPLWYRGYVYDPEEAACAILQRALDAMGAKRMVVGHTVQDDGHILSRCRERFFVIDVGISKAIRGHQAALEI
ncbi:Metallo-dependent phosphatase-like protein, partial [Thamnocephalis sphaerospora]